MIKRILVPIAGETLGPAPVEQVVSLARTHHARITGVVAVDWALEHAAPALTAITDVVARGIRLCQFRTDAEKALAELADACRRAGVPLEIERLSFDLVEAVCALSRSHDLIAFPRHGVFHPDVCHDPEAAVLQLIAAHVGPILSVGATPRTVRRALIAYSGSQASARSMKRFLQMNLWPGVEVRIAHVSDGSTKDPDRLIRDAIGYCRDWGVKAEPVQLEGEAAAALLDQARQFDADLLVVGDSARRLLQRKVFGDVTLQILRQPERSVFFAH